MESAAGYAMAGLITASPQVREVSRGEKVEA